jgi:hypothetical protein
MKMRSQGIGVDVPQGWDGEIYRRSGGFRPQGAGVQGETTSPVMHLGNFPLPTERGDYGSGAVEMMKADNILIVLFEFDRAAAGRALFARSGVPVVAPEDFAPDQMQRPRPGQTGAQYFFNDGGRAFCLYVALGSHARRRELVPEVNQVLSSLQLDQV